MRRALGRGLAWQAVAMATIILHGCATASYKEAECPLVVTLKARSFRSPDEILVEFSPGWLKRIWVYPPGPRAYRAPTKIVEDTKTRDSETLSGAPLPFRVELRPFDVGLRPFFVARSVWSALAWFDAYQEGHIAPGWYQVRLEYAPTNGSRERCILTTAPFFIEQEFTIPKGEFYDPREYLW